MGNKYSGLQIGIHWLVFLLVIVAYSAMEFRGFFPRSYRPLFNMVHVSCGITILTLMVARLLVRLNCAKTEADDDRNGASGASGYLSVVYCPADYWAGDDVQPG